MRGIHLTSCLAFILMSCTANAAPVDDSPYRHIDKASKLQQLTPLQIDVTQQDANEEPYRNAYWDNTASGIYVDVVSGEPLFSSTDKFDAGTGEPSFSKPIDPKYIETRITKKLLTMKITEVRSHYANSHLGFVFDDGPAPSYKRYSINSASLHFIPSSELNANGYASYHYLFNEKTIQQAKVKSNNFLSGFIG